VLELHGKLKQQARTNRFFEFVNAQSGTLICTDVAARGLDIPEVDWVIQFDVSRITLALCHVGVLANFHPAP
jgi:ATP-dependent RNA helicase DDX18/HAS1